MRQVRPRVSIRDVADRAGVAPSSVSRVLNGHPNIKPELRKQVEDAIKALGYQVNLVGAGLRRGTTHTVGFVIDDIANALFAEMMLGAEAALSEAGYLVTLMSSHGDGAGDCAAINLFKNRRVDGLLLAISDETDRNVRALIASAVDCPIVLLDRELPVSCSSVLTNHEQGIEVAVEELALAGHKKIGILIGSMKTRPGRERARAFRKAMAKRGLPVDDSMVVTHDIPSAASGEASMLKVLQRTKKRRPTAIIVGGSQLLVGLMRAIRTAQLCMPRDLSIIVCDDTPLAELHSPAITAVRRDVVSIGRNGAELLLEAMTNPEHVHAIRSVPVELVRRESVVPCR